ncbi:MAG: transcription termination/antitermination protein NusA [Proteobacteria bacterium]|nr:transcription termination/antitermination protein NusA [Pseudomonadota bacterium]
MQPRHEYLQVADAVAREKGIEKEQIIEVMESAIQRAARSKYGFEYDIRARIDHHSGDLDIFKVITVVDEVIDSFKEMTLADAKSRDKNAEVGDEFEESLPPVDFDRIAARTARGVILHKVREVERSNQYDIYKDKVGHIVSGIVKRIELSDIIVDLGQGEGIIRRDHIIPREQIRSGDRVRAVLVELKPESNGPIAFLSRTHPLMMARLFEQEVPEIYEGVIEIKSIARDAGSRAKMAVFTTDPTIDPVGSCVGVRGGRVQAIVAELQGEKVDIIHWSDNVATFIVNALQPASVSKVVIDEDANRVEVIVPQDQLSLAIGRRGQNVRLASILTGWSIDVMTDEEEVAKRLEENQARVEEFVASLDVDEMLAQLLCTEGFLSLEEIAYVDIADFAAIEGFDEDLASELQNRARVALDAKTKVLNEKVKKLKVEQRLIDLVNSEELLGQNALSIFVDKKIIALDDLAELSGDELLDLLGRNTMSIDDANAIIMKARAHWFE